MCLWVLIHVLGSDGLLNGVGNLAALAGESQRRKCGGSCFRACSPVSRGGWHTECSNLGETMRLVEFELEGLQREINIVIHSDFTVFRISSHRFSSKSAASVRCPTALFTRAARSLGILMACSISSAASLNASLKIFASPASRQALS